MQSPTAFVASLPLHSSGFSSLRSSSRPLALPRFPASRVHRASLRASASPSGAVATATKKFALISDVHVYDPDIWSADIADFGVTRVLGLANILLRRGPGRYNSAVLEAAMGDMRDEGVEHLICAGDITNLALECEFSKADEIFARFGDESEMTFCPGNHDIYVRSQKKARLYKKYFGKYSKSDVGIDSPRDDGFPFLHERNGIAFLGFNTGLPNTAVGAVGAKQFAAAEELLQKPESQAILKKANFTILVQHHPAQDPNLREMPLNKAFGRGFKDWRELGAFANDHKFDLVVHGHQHIPYQGRLASAPDTFVYESGSGTMMSDDPATMARYTVFELDGSKLVRTYSRVWNNNTSSFGTNELPVPE